MASDAAVKPAGVGIYFQEGDQVCVNHLIRGGSADRSGLIKQGDLVVSIDGRDMRSKGVEDVRHAIVGAEGSVVSIAFVRTDLSTGVVSEFSVDLVRGSPEHLAEVFGETARAGGPEGSALSGAGRDAEVEQLREALARSEQLRLGSGGGGGAEEAMIRMEEERKGFQEALRQEIGRRRHEEKLRGEAEAKLDAFSRGGANAVHERRIAELEAELAMERNLRVSNEAKTRQSAVPGSAADIDRLHEELAGAQQRFAQVDADLAAEKAHSLELATAVASLQAAAAQPQQAQPIVSLDQDFKDIARMCIIAVPHLLAHLRYMTENPDRIKAIVPTSVVMMQALDHTRAGAISCIPQSMPQLVSLLLAKQTSTVREASFAIALTSTSQDGRQVILEIPQAVPHLSTLLSSEDVHARRHSALAIGNLAMEPQGRRTLLQVFSLVQDLTTLLQDADTDCIRSTALAIGNLIVEDDARMRFLQVPMSVRILSERLRSADRYLVRYAAGALRNVAIDEKGRKAVLAQQEAVAALKGLLSSPDAATARFAESALKNLSITPFTSTMGPHDPRLNGRAQVPYRADKPSILGFELPFSDGDGLGVPQFRTTGGVYQPVRQPTGRDASISL